MAKKKAEKKVEEVTSDEAKRGRKVMITDKDGNEHARVDVIKRLYNEEGKKRSEIVKILQEEYSHTVPYQIVFAATKPVKGESAEGEADEDEGEAEAA